MNSPIPDTRHSLILRLTDPEDAQAWEEFAAIYGPLVFRLARAKGFQDADAREVSQEVLLAVSRAVHRWEPNHQKGRFRDWLFRITRNWMINFLSRRNLRSIAGGESLVQDLADPESRDLSSESDEFELEYRREVFRWAAEQVQQQVREPTWRAFWLVAVEQDTVPEVSSKLGISIGAVHIACSRVRARLRDCVARWEEAN